jgi:nicotinate-nucleotide pyrophosphorylase (carboxylating)
VNPLQFPPKAAWRPLLEMALAEDLGPGDVTSRIVISSDARGHARIEARQTMVVCGLPLVAAVFHAVDESLELHPQTEDGKTVPAGTTLLRISGSTLSIMAGERLALNFLGRLGGVATYTREYVDAVEGSGVEIIDTRKTLPGWRLLDKYAVLAGGGSNHRIGLFDGILLKDNHVAAAGGVARAVTLARDNAPKNLRIQCEVESLEDARHAFESGADMLLLDNQTPDQIREIAAICPPHLVLEASGGITLKNVRDYASSGVHRISIGALTHSAPVVDVALEMDSAPDDAAPQSDTLHGE